ncbi:hypothetical protein [Aquimarina pacifica]|uniref:hypothetical protein n=1 Tax=Aquimarina pacifica TaxID=1296415 RepID=UPI00047134B1|nr:hypothetical protein [Aquimarina pacifica]
MKQYINHFLLLFLLFPLLGNAQVFPVQVTPQMIPPYSLKLSEYSTLNSEKLILNLILSDIAEPTRQVRLKLYIENNAGLSVQSTDVVIGANPIFIDGGVPLRLSNSDLQSYFLLENLVGITPQQYSSTLPEGLYRFCFEVYDVLSGLRISRKSCATAYLVLNDPPFLNIPLEGEYVSFKDPQNIIFQWTPRHLNATNVSYEFTLTELWDNQMDPQAAFLASQPLFQTTTFATTLLYGPTETPLLEDKMYGWRVRAMVNGGISETSVFKNDGYSEIYYFTYTGDCPEPEQIISEASDTTTEKIYWQGVNHIQYDVQYRKKGNTGTNNWFNGGTINEYTTIYNLEPNTSYEFRVGGQCIENGPYTYSQIYEFTTIHPEDDETMYNCGITPEIVIANQDPLQQLVANETFMAGDFPVTVKEVTSGNGSYEMFDPEKENTNQELETPVNELSETSFGSQDKTYSGWGFIEVKYLNDTRIKVSFENIKINTDYQLIDGVVKTDYDKNWGGLVSVDEVLEPFEGDNDLRNIDLDYDITIENISIADDGSIVITHPTSGATTEYTGGDDTIIMDTNVDGTRDIFHVDADGNIREGGQMAPGGGISPENTSGITSNGEVTALTAEGIKVEFLEYTDYTYGFDQIPSKEASTLAKYYDQIKDTQGNPYNIINKSVGNGDTDIIRARVTITDASLSMNNLVIKTLHGENIDYQITGDNEITLNLKGYYSFEHENIYATLQPEVNNTDKQTIAGVFSQWHLANKDVNLTVVNVNGADLPSASALQSQINSIYKQASVTFNVSIENMSFSKSQIGVGDGSILSNNYTADQSEIIAQYKQLQSTNPKSYYVFVFGNSTKPSKNIAGFMPLKRQFGFVFSSNLSDQTEGKSSLVGTLAHELGHGAFALEHPFSKLGTTQGNTDWLQDYGNGTRLSHLDWAQIHNPEFRLYLFQDSEDASLTLSFLNPNWHPFTYTGEGSVVFTETIPQQRNGAVYAIKHKNKLYEWVANEYNILNGAYINNGEPLSNEFIKEAEYSGNDIPVQLYWNKGDCTKNEIYATTFLFIENYIDQLDLSNGVDGLNSEEKENIVFIGTAGCPTNANCGNIVLTDLQPEINELIAISHAINTTPIANIETKVTDLSICGLKELEYTIVQTLLITIMAQETYTDKTERAIVKLMECIPDNKSIDFYNTLKQTNDRKVLTNAIQKTNNVAFTEFSEGEFSSFINILAEMVVQSESDTEKWFVLNTLIKNKFNNLEEETTPLGLQTIIASLKAMQGEENQVKVSRTFTLFIDMLKDSYITNTLSDFKLILDIASIRHENRELFRLFTISDFITLIKNPNYVHLGYTTPSVEKTQDLQISSKEISWILPYLNFETFESYNEERPWAEGEYILEDDYLQNNCPWYRYMITNDINKSFWDANPQEFLTIFHEQLLYYLNLGTESNAEFWARTVTVNCDNIDKVIRHINLNENTESLGVVSEETRFSFIQAYFDPECTYFETAGTDTTTNDLEGVGNSLMKVLSSFSPSDPAIIELLEIIGLEKIDDRLRNTQFEEFVVWLGTQIIASDSGLPLEKSNVTLSKSGDIVTANPMNLLQLEANIFQRQNFSGNLVGNKILINGTPKAYNQIVAVHVLGSFTFLDQEYRHGDILLIPLIQAYAMSESNQRIVRWNSAFLAADVVSFAIPFVGGGIRVFRVAGYYATKVIMASDIVASAASALVTALNADSIDADLRFRIQMAAIATSIPGFFTKMPDTDVLRSLRSNIDTDLNDLARTGGISSEAATILKKSYGGSMTKIPGVPDELEAAFRADFPNLSRADELDADFFNGWVTYRRNHPDTNICN